jgi:hypothetical protein
MCWVFLEWPERRRGKFASLSKPSKERAVDEIDLLLYQAADFGARKVARGKLARYARTVSIRIKVREPDLTA